MNYPFMALHIVFHYPALFFPILYSFIFFFLLFSFSSFIFACFAPTKALKSQCTKQQISSPSHVWRSCPVIYKLIRKEAVCNGGCEAKAFIFLAVSSRESVLGLKWTNDVNIKFISSKLNTSGNLHQEPLIPLSLLPEVNHMPVLGWKVVIHYV